jgi:hypothetical protein
MEKEREKDKADGDDQLEPSSQSPDSVAESGPPKVISIEDWVGGKNRASREGAVPAPVLPYQERLRLMSTQQKQAVLLRVIMSDDIDDRELDSLLLVLASPA